MDFRSLSRKELQSLCKLNKIPANITNVAMADALQSLEIVVGMEDFVNVSQSETTVDVVESVEVSSPKAPHTRCRTTTRQRVKPTETETKTVTKTTRRGSKQQLPREEVEKEQLKVEAMEDIVNVPQSETTADLVETVEVSSPKAPLTRCRNSTRQRVKPTETETKTVTRTTRRGSKQQLPMEEVEKDQLKIESAVKKKAPRTAARRTVNEQLNDCETEAAVGTKYSTRRSTRLTEKKPTSVKNKGVEKPDSSLDATSNQPRENYIKTNEVVDLCNAFENVVAMEEEGDNDRDKIDIQKPESDGNAPFEDDFKMSPMIDDEKPESDPCELASGEDGVVQASDETTIVGSDAAKLDNEDTLCADLDINNHVPQINVDETESAVDNHCIMPEEVEDMEPELLTAANNVNKKSDAESETDQIMEEVDELTGEDVSEKSEAESGPVPDQLTLSHVTGHPTHVTEEVEDLEPEIVTNNNVNESDAEESGHANISENADEETGPAQNSLISTVVMGHLTHVTENNVEDLKPEVGTVSDPANVNEKPDAESGPIPNPFHVMGHPTHVAEEVEELTEKDVSEKSEAESGLVPDLLNLSHVTGHPTHVTEEVKDMEPEIFTNNNVNESDAHEKSVAESDPAANVNEKSDAESSPVPSPLTLSHVMSHLAHVNEDLKPEIFTNNNVNDSDAHEKSVAESGPANISENADVETGLAQNQLILTDVEEEPDLVTENNVNEKSDAESPPANVNETSDTESGPTETPLILTDVTGHPTHVTSVKNTSEELEDLKPEPVTENNAHETKCGAESGPAENPTPVSSVKKATPFKKSMSDDKENNMVVDEGKFGKKERGDDEIRRSLNELSIRQLKRQLKKEELLILTDVTGHPTHVTEDVEDLKFVLVTENNAHQKKSDAESGPAENPTPVSSSVKKATPFKNMSSAVSDDKENNMVMEEGNLRKKEKDEEGEKIKKSLNEMSIRELKKQLKALTLKTLNSKEDGGEGGTTRHALQALSENQIV